MLLDAGADPNIETATFPRYQYPKYNALMFAIHYDQRECMDLLINITSNVYKSMNVAHNHGSIYSMTLLIKKGVKYKCCDAKEAKKYNQALDMIKREKEEKRGAVVNHISVDLYDNIVVKY